MSCYFTAAGPGFDVDRFLRESGFEAYRVWCAGEVFPGSRRGAVAEDSGFQMDVSSAPFDRMDLQVADATAFLRGQVGSLQRLMSFEGLSVDEVYLHFGVEHGSFSTFDIPPELGAAAGNLGVSIRVSIYEVTDGRVRFDAR